MYKPVLALVVLSTVLLMSCKSGKEAYKRGNYYEAILQAVQRLREEPGHKTANEVLKLSYPLAIEQFEADSKNQILADAHLKYNKILQNHKKINRLHDEIKKSPSALRVIPNPINKYEEIAELRQKAAEEAYNAGIQALLEDTREDAKKAYYLFKESNNLSPGYKEALEMARQAKINATLKVMVYPDIRDENNWYFEAAILNVKPSDFVQFYSLEKVEREQLGRMDQSIRIVEKGLSKYPPSISKRETHFSDSVRVDNVKNTDKTPPRYKEIKATLTMFKKYISAKGSLRLIIVDEKSNLEILNTDVRANDIWTGSWARCTGDIRALPEYTKSLCNIPEKYMPRGYFEPRVKKGLDRALAYKLELFYRNY